MSEVRDLLAQSVELVLQTLTDCRVAGAEQDLAVVAPVVGSVHLDGNWQGTVAVHLSVPLARHLAASMFDCPLNDATPDRVVDTVGEIANMIGGSLKSLLRADARLSLPAVDAGPRAAPRSRPVGDYPFRCRGAAGRVELWSHGGAPAPAVS